MLKFEKEREKIQAQGLYMWTGISILFLSFTTKVTFTVLKTCDNHGVSINSSK